MKRPVLVLLMAATIGALYGWTGSASLAFLMPLFLVPLFLRGEAKKLGIAFSVVLLLTVWQAREQKAPSVTESRIGHRWEMHLVVIGIKNETEFTKPYLAAMLDGIAIGETVLIQLPKESEELRIGQIIKATGESRRADRTQNDGLFSYGDYLKRNGIEGLVRINGKVDDLGFAESFLLTLRRRTLENIEEGFRALFSQREADLMTTVLTARSLLEADSEESFRALGITHLLSVSGLHAGILFGLTLTVGRLFLHKRTTRLVALCLLSLYSWLIGFPISVVRALIMAFVLVMARNLRKPYDPLTALFFAATLILVLYPGSVIDAGFHLSVAGVWSVIWLGSVIAKRYPQQGIVQKMTQQVFAIQMGILPMILLHFGTYPLLGILANFFLVPLFGMMVSLSIPVLLLYFILPGTALTLSFLPKAFIGVFFYLAEGFSKIPVPILSYQGFNLTHVIGYYLLLYMILRPGILFALPENLRRGTLITVAVALMVAIYSGRWSPPSVLMIDVGQGEAILIKDGFHRFLIDTGGEIREEMTDSFEAIVKPVLLREGVHVLDGIFVSHFDADHTENLPSVIQHFPTRALLLPEGLKESAEGKQAFKYGVPVIWLSAGDGIRLADNRYIDILYAAERKAPNDSLVMRYQVNKSAALFTGDLEKESEKMLLGSSLQSDIIKIGHHGSRTSTSKEFLYSVKPKSALISAGYGNPFGHPHPEVLQLLSEENIEIWRTDQQGNLRIRFTGEEYQVQGYPTESISAGAVALSMTGLMPIAMWVRREGRRTADAAYGLSEKIGASGRFGSVHTLRQ